jgi:hypothetical protein
MSSFPAASPTAAAAMAADLQCSAASQPCALDFTQRIEKKISEYNASNSVLKRWLLEILSWLISAVCLAAIVAIYIRIEDEYVFGPEYTLINVANTLGKIMSAALIIPTSEALGQLKWNWFYNSSNAMWDFEIFDKATRGPWGAAMLLYRTKGRSLAALGAVLVMLMLAIDTFLQQVVIFSDRQVVLTKLPEVPRSVRWQPDLPEVYQEGALLAYDEVDMAHLVTKFAYGAGTTSVTYYNTTLPDIDTVSGSILFG